MGIIKGEIPLEIEEEFRKIIVLKYGMKKGNISIALQNAIEEWILKQKRLINKDKMITERILKDIRRDYKDKFIAIDNDGIVVKQGTSLQDIYNNLDPNQSLRIIVPETSRLNKVYTKRQLNWPLQRKSRSK